MVSNEYGVVIGRGHMINEDFEGIIKLKNMMNFKK